ncbi:hypothetical protein D3C73_1450260 [compost metagenome]
MTRPAAALHREDDHRHRARDEAAQQQRHVEQEIQGDRSADHLGEIRGHRHELCLQPVRPSCPAVAQPSAQHLGQALTGDDAELG